MNSINKPNKVVSLADWAWKGEAPTYNPKKATKRQKKKHCRFIHHARRNAHAALKALGKPTIIQLDNRELASRLWREGLLDSGPYSKKSAREALVAWYKGLKIKISPDKKPIPKKKDFAKTDNFLRSWEWTSLRYEALKLHGRKCQCCGAMPPEIVLHVDHIKSRSKHPELALDIDNLQVLCELCNKGKSNIYEDDFRP